MEITEQTEKKTENKIEIDDLTPSQIVSQLDRYIIGQNEAKKSVAIAVRNRVRRRKLDPDLQSEIYPKNIIMIGPTGCGKTEIARRLSRLTGAPFVKVEATKYTEVGYVGRDVESMVRDLVTNSINIVRKEYEEKLAEVAKQNTKERILDLLMPSSQTKTDTRRNFNSTMGFGDMSSTGQQAQAGMDATAQETEKEEAERRKRARELMRKKLEDGEFEDKEVEVDVEASNNPMVQVLSGQNMEDIDMQVQGMLGDLLPKKNKRKRVTVEEARKILHAQELEKLIDPDKVQVEAIRRAEQMGIIFIDEIDKVCGRSGTQSGPDVSREGVQRDLLPIVEGATINTRNGPVKTDHILFIAAGAFHSTKPSDLIPELQGRFPIRVELEKLTQEDFRQILTAPQNSLTQQAIELLKTDEVLIHFTDDALDELSALAFRVNEATENIGARRLHTIMERLLENISFEGPDLPEDQRNITIDKDYVLDQLKEISENRDLSDYIL